MTRKSESISAGLDADQIKAVTHDKGPMMVLAGPGSGKTMVITHRVKWLIEKAGADPASILVVTFTRAAADEMRQRFVSMMGMNLPVSFGTFHSIFFAVLRSAYKYTADNIIREESKIEIVKDLIESMEIETDNIAELTTDILAEISLVKGEMIDPAKYYAVSCGADVFRKIFQRYQDALIKSNLIDFDDMMVYTYELFKARPDYLKAWQRKFSYILIDEFQDINSLQYRIIRMLAKPHKNIFIVGDDDQSIYGFRGARPSIMKNFASDFNGSLKVYLSTNYRSTPQIVKTAGILINKNHDRFSKKIKAERSEGKPVDIRVFEDIYDESLSVVSRIRSYHDNENIPYADMAVLFRTNMQARVIMEKLMEYNIPFIMKESIPNIYEHWIAQDMFSYINISRGSRRRSDFLRIINRPNRYISRSTLDSEEVSIYRLREVYKDKDWMVKRLDKLIYDLSVIRGMEPYAAINYIRRGIGYDEFLSDYAKSRRLDEQELFDVLEELHEGSRQHRSFKEWNNYILQYKENLKDQNTKKSRRDSDAVTLATMHHSKGLEYDVVFIPDVNEKIIPHHKALLPEDIEEERRLFYVAMTRAKKRLHIFFVKERFGRDIDMSRFIHDIMNK